MHETQKNNQHEKGFAVLALISHRIFFKVRKKLFKKQSIVGVSYINKRKIHGNNKNNVIK